MSRKRRAPERGPARLYSLTQSQTDLVRKAAACGPHGLYLGLGSSWGDDAGALVASGLAAWRTVARSSNVTRSATDDRLCEWTDLYLVATPAGLAMLARFP